MKKLIERQTIGDNIKAYNAYQQFGKLLDELKLRQFPGETISLLNHEIEQLNAIEVSDSSFVKAIKRSENKVVKFIEKERFSVRRNRNSLSIANLKNRLQKRKILEEHRLA